MFNISNHTLPSSRQLRNNNFGFESRGFNNSNIATAETSLVYVGLEISNA